MTRRAAFRQCDVVRALKAARATGAARVVVRLDGSLAIEVHGEAETPRDPFADRYTKPKDIVL